MKRFTAAALGLALLAAAALSALSGCASEMEKLSARLTNYELELVYSEDTKTLSGECGVNYINSADVPVTSVCFLLHTSTFREGAAYKPVTALRHSKAYPSGTSYGDTEVSAVTLGGSPAEFEVGGEDMHVLTVQLSEELFPGDRIDIGITFAVKLANVRHRTGYAEDTVNFGNFYPVAAVYGKDGYLTYPYYANGDPFFSEAANYKVKITVPSDYIGAFSGAVTSDTAGENTRTYEAEAAVMRDFAMVFSKAFSVHEAAVGDTRVLYYTYRDDNAEANLACAVNALTAFSDMFGAYEYPVYSVVRADLCFAGMEYPGLVMISDTLSAAAALETIAHETAHQWWYALVGNDQVAHPWLDEALSDYSTALFFEKYPDYGITLEEYVKYAAQNFRTFATVYKQVIGNVNTAMNRGLDTYLTEAEYVAVAYSRGTVMFHEIDKGMGRQKFLAALKNYYKRNRFGVADPAELAGCLDAAARAKVSLLLESFLNGSAVI